MHVFAAFPAGLEEKQAQGGKGEWEPSKIQIKVAKDLFISGQKENLSSLYTQIQLAL